MGSGDAWGQPLDLRGEGRRRGIVSSAVLLRIHNKEKDRCGGIVASPGFDASGRASNSNYCLLR